MTTTTAPVVPDEVAPLIRVTDQALIEKHYDKLVEVAERLNDNELDQVHSHTMRQVAPEQMTPGALSRLAWLLTDVLSGLEFHSISFSEYGTGVTVADVVTFHEVIDRLEQRGWERKPGYFERHDEEPMIQFATGLMDLSATADMRNGDDALVVSLSGHWTGSKAVRA